VANVMLAAISAAALQPLPLQARRVDTDATCSAADCSDCSCPDPTADGDGYSCSSDSCMFRRVANGKCANKCLHDYENIPVVCPRNGIVDHGDLEPGSCSDAGYSVCDGTETIDASVCGELQFALYLPDDAARARSQGARRNFTDARDATQIGVRELDGAGQPLGDNSSTGGARGVRSR